MCMLSMWTLQLRSRRAFRANPKLSTKLKYQHRFGNEAVFFMSLKEHSRVRKEA